MHIFVVPLVLVNYQNGPPEIETKNKGHKRSPLVSLNYRNDPLKHDTHK